MMILPRKLQLTRQGKIGSDDKLCKEHFVQVQIDYYPIDRRGVFLVLASFIANN